MKKLILLSILLIAGCEETLEPEDCAGVAGGTAGLDSCAVCIGGTTNLTACTQDCAGVWGGSSVEDCTGVCDGTTELDECGVCGGDGKQTNYVEECENEYVCNNVTVWVDLGASSYCSSNSCNPYQYCSYKYQCQSQGGFAGTGCDSNSYCISGEYQTQTECGYETVCQDVEITSCP